MKYEPITTKKSMTLNSFREELNQHEGALTWITTSIFGEEKEVIKVKSFLKGFEHHQANYEFTYADGFQLLWLLKSQSNITLIKRLQGKLTHFLGEAIINLIDKLENDGKKVTLDVFNSIILFLNNIRSYRVQGISKAFILLMEKQIFDETIIITLTNDNEHFLPEIIKHLKELNRLTSFHLIKILETGNLYFIEKFLNILAKEKVQIDDEFLLKSIELGMVNLSQITTESNLLIKEKLFTQNYLKLMFPLNYSQLMDLSRLLKSAFKDQDKFSMDENTFNWVVRLIVNDKYSFSVNSLLTNISRKENKLYELLSFLDEKKLLTDPFLKLISDMDDKQVKRIYSFLHDVLIKYRCIDNTTVEWMLSKKSPLTFADDDIKKACVAFEILSSSGLLEKNLQLLVGLKPNQFLHLTLLIIKLDGYELLSQDNFLQAYASIVSKLSPPIAQTVEVQNKLQTGKARTALIFKDKTVYLEDNQNANNQNDKKLTGAFGEVKQGYADLENLQAKYAIKEPNQNNDMLQSGFNASPTQQCRREVKYGQLLGRNTVYFFHENKPSSVTDWLNGIMLADLSSEKATNTPIIIRLKWLASALTDLNAMHGAFRSHNDIKNENFILDLGKDKLQLIDFGISCRPIPEKRRHYYFDIGRMGISTLPRIFPDILMENSNADETITPLLKGAIKKLEEMMTAKDPGVRCNCPNALLYCQELITNYAILNKELLEDITTRTICPKEKKVADVLYEYSECKGDNSTCSIM